MTALKRTIEIELINVHQVRGDKGAIIFLKNAEHDFVEGLFYHAKRYGRSEFFFRDEKYIITKNKDASFLIEPDEEQDVSTESFA